MHAVYKALPLLIIFCSVFNSFSQTPSPQKVFETPDPRWWDKSYYGKDSVASAVILFDYGTNKTGALATVFNHQRRIKILDKNALRLANIHFATGDNGITEFKGVVYNMVNGHVTSTIVDRKSFLKTSIIEGIQRTSVAFPKVVEGSVIEYSYQVRTLPLRITDWTFQMPVPVKWSEYEVDFGDHTPNMVANIGGIYRPEIRESKKGWKNYLLKDLPAFIEEPLMPDVKYFRSLIYFTINPGGHLSSANNGKGKDIFTIEKIGKEISLRDSAEMDTDIFTEVTLTISPEDDLIGTMTVRKTGRGREIAINSIRRSGESQYFRSLLGSSNWQFSNPVVSSETDSTLELTIRCDLAISNQVQNNDSIIYINPLLMLPEERIPFSIQDRKYPLDFESRIERSLVVSFEIPANYRVSELPKDVVTNLRSGRASFWKGALVKGNKVYLTTTFTTSQILFETTEYPALRDLFQRTVAADGDLIVLKKGK